MFRLFRFVLHKKSGTSGTNYKYQQNRIITGACYAMGCSKKSAKLHG